MLKTLWRCPAYWPRSTPSSTVDYNDRLETCYALFTNTGAPVNESQINFVFCHGSQCTKEMYYTHVDLLYDRLGDRLGKCISIDCVSHGDSALVNHNKLGSYTGWDDIARDIGLVMHDCMDNHGLVGHNVFMGHSMGAMCGMVLAAFEPSLFDCLVPWDPIYIDMKTIGPAMDAQVKLVKWAMRGKDTFGSWGEYEQYYRKTFCRRWDSRVIEHFVPAAAIEMPDGTVQTKANIANQMSAYLGSNPLFGTNSSLLKYIRIPTLVMYGTQIDKLSASDPSLLAEVVMDGYSKGVPSGHNFPMRVPEITIDLLLPFVLEKCSTLAWHRSPKSATEATRWQLKELRDSLKLREWYVEHDYDAKLMPKL